MTTLESVTLASVTLEVSDPAAAETSTPTPSVGRSPACPLIWRADERLPRVHAVARGVPAQHRRQPHGDRHRAGATTLKPASKGLWGYGGCPRAPDGPIWKIATSSKKDTGPATREVDDIVLLLGVADVKATKKFYVDRGLAVKRSFGAKYVEFDTPGSQLKLRSTGAVPSPRTPALPEATARPHRIATRPPRSMETA